MKELQLLGFFCIIFLAIRPDLHADIPPYLGALVCHDNHSRKFGSVTLVAYEGSQFFITAGHLIKTDDDPRYGTYTFTVYLQGKEFVYRQNDFTVSEEDDIAFVKIKGPSLPNPLGLADRETLNKDDEVLVYGFPRGRSGMSKGKIQYVLKGLILFSGQLSGGSSGGPVIVSMEGADSIVGIVSAKVLYDGKILYSAVSYDHIIKNLEELSH